MEERQEAEIAEIATRRKKHGEAFYVVGGPVQPRRGCYIERTADQRLLETLLDGEYCYVLAPQQTGKSSLVAKTAGRLRRQGFLSAVVDLSLTVTRDKQVEAGRWYYGIAYRIVRDLRLNVDLQHWWQEKKPLSPLQRLNEFFWEVVLAETRAPIVIFLDEIEAVEHLDYAVDLFVSVRSCHDARASEPDYERLRFVLLGAALPVDVPGGGSSMYDIGRRIDLGDFSFQEARPLCNELGHDSGDAERTLYRILYWTGGHPYLTQKLCRAVARSTMKAESDEVVDRLVRSRFLAGNAPFNEPNLRGMRDLLSRRDKLAQSALRTYRRVRRGRKVHYDQHDSHHEFLRIAGLVRVTEDRLLAVRNKIYAQVFSSRWVSQNVPFNWRSTGAAASVILLLVGVPYWYARLLPKPYIETLQSETATFEAASEAYRGLHRIPGFATTADELFAVVLEERSRAASEWDEVLATDIDLRALEGYIETADELLAGFWDRRATDAEVVEMRDRALIYRLRALDEPSPLRFRRMAALLGDDYRSLVTVVRPNAPIEGLSVDAAGETVITLRDGNVINTWSAGTGLPFGERAGFQAMAEQFVATRRQIEVETPGRVGTARLSVTLDHAQPTDLKVRLISPAGSVAVLPILRPNPNRDPTFVFSATAERALAALMREDATGTWSLEVEDQQSGTTGFLRSWELRVSARAGHTLLDTPKQPVPIADPQPTSDVQVALSPDGRRIAAVSADPSTRGYLQVWDVNAGTVTARVPVAAGARTMAFDSEGLFIVTGESETDERLHVWRVAAGQELQTLTPRTSFVSRPAMSVTGSFLAIADGNPDNGIRLRLWDLVGGNEIRGPRLAGAVRDIAVGPAGRWLAALDDEYVVRVWDVESRQIHRLMRHTADVVRLLFDPSGRWLVTIDSKNVVRVWDLREEGGREPLLIRENWDSASVAFDASGNRILLHTRARSFQVMTLPEAVPLMGPLRHSGEWAQTDRSSLTGGLMATVFSTNGSRVVTGIGGRSARVWDLGDDVADFVVDEDTATEAGGSPITQSPVVHAVNPVADQYVVGDAAGAVLFVGTGSERDASESDEPVSGHTGAVTALAYSAEGNRLVSAAADGSLQLWDAGSLAAIGEPVDHMTGVVRSVALSADGTLALVGGELGARLLSTETGEVVLTLDQDRPARSVALAGDAAATLSEAGDVVLARISDGGEIWSAQMPDSTTSLALAADGDRLAIGDMDGMIVLFDKDGPAGRRISMAVNGSILALGFNDSGDRLVVQTGEWLHVLGAGEMTPKVISSQLLPGIVPVGAWRPRSTDATEIKVLVEGEDHALLVKRLDLTNPRVDIAELGALRNAESWLEKFKLRFNAAGSLVPRFGESKPGSLTEISGGGPADETTTEQEQIDDGV